MEIARPRKSEAKNSTQPDMAKRPVLQGRSATKRLTVVDGAFLEPESRRPQFPKTHGSFNQHDRHRVPDQARRPRNAQPRSEPPYLAYSPHQTPSHTTVQTEVPAAMQVPQPKPKSKDRYYSRALSNDDKAALAAGEENHNLKQWTGDDLINYQVSRIELVPYDENRQDVVAVIMDDKRRSEQFLLKSKRQVRRFLRSPLTKLDLVSKAEDKSAYETQTRKAASKSMVDLRLMSELAPVLSPTTPSSPPPSSVAEQRYQRQSTYSGQSGNSDYFPNKPRSSVAPSAYSTDSSSVSSHVRSSLPSEARPYVRNEDLTFDSFLTPHISGKGETHRQHSEVAMKEKEKSRGLAGLRRLSKMPSTPMLKKRSSPVDLSPLKL